MTHDQLPIARLDGGGIDGILQPQGLQRLLAGIAPCQACPEVGQQSGHILFPRRLQDRQILVIIRQRIRFGQRLAGLLPGMQTDVQGADFEPSPAGPGVVRPQAIQDVEQQEMAAKQLQGGGQGNLEIRRQAGAGAQTAQQIVFCQASRRGLEDLRRGAGQLRQNGRAGGGLGISPCQRPASV